MKIRMMHIFNCDYCNKEYKQIKRMIRHEKFCFKKEENRYLPACFQNGHCKHLITEKKNECERKNAHFKCTLTNTRYHTIRAGQKQSVDLTGCVLMPKECSDFISKEPISPPHYSYSRTTLDF